MHNHEGWRSIILDSVDLTQLLTHDMKPEDLRFDLLDKLTLPSDDVRNSLGDAGIIGFGVDVPREAQM